MVQQPTLQTRRLLLRGFLPADGPRVRELAGAREIADTTLNIPHPYEEGVAEKWIASHPDQLASGKAVHFAVVLRREEVLIGAVGLNDISSRHQHAELGYWIGLPYWGRGYCTEAVGAILEYGFRTLGLNRIHGHHLARNPASGRVMEKAGMTLEGTVRQAVRKWDRFEDVALRSILKSEYESKVHASRRQP